MRIAVVVGIVIAAFFPHPLAAEEKVDKVSLAHIKLTGALDETPQPNDPLFGNLLESFQSKVDRIRRAKEDKKIHGLILEIDGLAVQWGKLNELRQAVLDFRKSGKKVFAYFESATTVDYLLAVSCDEICLPESGWLVVTGLRGEALFFKDLLEKLGIQAEMMQIGDYKGAAEPFTRSSMSPPFRKNLENILDDYFEKSLVDQIVEHRKLPKQQVKKLIDRAPFTAREAKKVGLVDRVAYVKDFEAHIKAVMKAEAIDVVKNYGKSKSSSLDLSNPFAFFKLFAPPVTTRSKKPKVAVIYATGVIAPGKGGTSLLGANICGSTTMIEAIQEAEKDETVKAIVLRVDSPGGSALASDLIWNALVQCKKPVIASMSDVAASGGYYISMGADKIYAEPGTLTGSIGVVGGKLAMAGLYDKIGIKTEIITRGKNATIFSTDTPFSDSERKRMKALMQDIYEQFVDKAVQGRTRAGKKFTKKEFLNYAGGRVWTGRQAKEVGLVDALGTLGDAIADAWKMAKMDPETKPEILVLPKPKTFMELLLENQADAHLSQQLGILDRFPEARRHFQIAEALLHLRHEPVWAVMPCRIQIR
ncbi:MAG: protease IV [Gemmatales bacterium]|nr:MAG: protease IV [Gemmatales bacterium]